MCDHLMQVVTFLSRGSKDSSRRPKIPQSSVPGSADDRPSQSDESSTQIQATSNRAVNRKEEGDEKCAAFQASRLIRVQCSADDRLKKGEGLQ